MGFLGRHKNVILAVVIVVLLQLVAKFISSWISWIILLGIAVVGLILAYRDWKRQRKGE